jgi:hypothetical protein
MAFAHASELFALRAALLSASFLPLRLHRLAKISPLARYFLLLCQKKVSKENATRFRSTALALNSFSWSEGKGAGQRAHGSGLAARRAKAIHRINVRNWHIPSIR